MNKVYSLPINTVKNAVLVSGLFWQTLSPVQSKKIRPFFDKESESLKFDAGALLKGESTQIGFFNRNESNAKKVRYYSLAALVFSYLNKGHHLKGDSFIYVDRLDSNTFIYVAVRNGVILPAGDQALSKEGIEKKLNDDLSVVEWDNVFITSEVDVSHVKNKTSPPFIISDLFTKKGLEKQTPVSLFVKGEHKSPSKKAVIILSVVILAGAAGGYKYWSDKKKAEQAALDRAAMLAMQNQAPVKPPWESLVAPTHFVSGCLAALSQLNLSPAGWTVTEAYCNETSLNVSLAQPDNGAGTPLQLHALLPKAKIALDGLKASFSQPIDYGKPQDNDVMVSHDIRVDEINSQSQRVGFKVDLVDIQPPIITPAQGQPAPPPPSWRVVGWSIKDSVVPPRVVLDALNAGGFRIKRITLTPKETEGAITWSMEGVQYVKQ